MKIIKTLIICLVVGYSTIVFAQTNSDGTFPTMEQFQAMLTTCAVGAGIEIDGQMRGSIAEVYSGAKSTTEARKFKFLTAGEFLKLLPAEDRLEGYKLYNECIVKILGGEKLPENDKEQVKYTGTNEDLVSFLGWYGDGSFSYTGGTCKGCPNLEKFNGTGTFKPNIMISDQKYISKLDFLRDGVTIDSVKANSLTSGSNTIFKGISHSIIKVDGSRNNYYGGRTSYCWSGTHQQCVAIANDKKAMMQFVAYRLNLHSYKIRVTRNDGVMFIIDLPKVTY